MVGDPACHHCDDTPRQSTPARWGAAHLGTSGSLVKGTHGSSSPLWLSSHSLKCFLSLPVCPLVTYCWAHSAHSDLDLPPPLCFLRRHLKEGKTWLSGMGRAPRVKGGWSEGHRPPNPGPEQHMGMGPHGSGLTDTKSSLQEAEAQPEPGPLQPSGNE